MLTVQRKESRIEIVASINIPGAGVWNYTFSWDGGGRNDQSAFVTAAIQAMIGDHLEAARKQAYAAGWKDAKGHKVKREWASRRWVWPPK